MKNLITLALLWLLALVPALAQTAPQLRPVASFRAVEVGNGIELRLTSGQPQRVEASADTPEQLTRIKTEVRDGVLKITFDREMGDFRSKKANTRNLRVSVTAAALTGLQVVALKYTTAGSLHVEALNLAGDGSHAAAAHAGLQEIGHEIGPKRGT